MHYFVFVFLNCSLVIGWIACVQVSLRSLMFRVLLCCSFGIGGFCVQFLCVHFMCFAYLGVVHLLIWWVFMKFNVLVFLGFSLGFAMSVCSYFLRAVYLFDDLGVQFHFSGIGGCFHFQFVGLISN